MVRVDYQLLAEQYKQQGLTDWSLAAKLISRNKEYAAQGDPSVTSKIKYLKEHGSIGLQKAEAIEAARAGASKEDVYNISQGLTTVKTTTIPQQTIKPASSYTITGSPQTFESLVFYERPEFKKQDRLMTTREGVVTETQGNKVYSFQLGGLGTGGLKIINSDEYGSQQLKTTRPFFVVQQGTTPKEWAQSVGYSRFTSNVEFSYRPFVPNTMPLQISQGQYEFNYPQQQLRQQAYNLQVKADRGIDITKELQYYNYQFTDRGLRPEYAKKYAQDARISFLSKDDKTIRASRFEELGLGFGKTSLGFAYSISRYQTALLENTYKFDEKGKRIKTDGLIPRSEYFGGILTTPTVKGFAPANILKYSFIGMGTAGLGVTGYSNIKTGVSRYGVREGIYQGSIETLKNLAPFKPVSNQAIYNPSQRDLSFGQSVTTRPSQYTYIKTGGGYLKGQTLLNSKIYQGFQYTEKGGINAAGKIGAKGYLTRPVGQLYGTRFDTLIKTDIASIKGVATPIRNNIYDVRTQTIFKTNIINDRFQIQVRPIAQNIQTGDKKFKVLDIYKTDVGRVSVIKGFFIKTEPIGTSINYDFSKTYNIKTPPTSPSDKGYTFLGRGSSSTKTGTDIILLTKTTQTYNIKGSFASAQVYNIKTVTEVKPNIFTTRTTQTQTQQQRQQISFTSRSLLSQTSLTQEKTKITPLTITETKTSSSNRYRYIDAVTLTSSQKQDSSLKNVLVTSFTGASITPSFKPPIVTTGPPITPRGFNIPPILPFDTSSFGRVKGSRKRPKYTPSFAALTFNIRGTKPKKQIGLLGVRPIPKGFKWSY
jgi:hypothetical protein